MALKYIKYYTGIIQTNNRAKAKDFENDKQAFTQHL